MTHRKPSRARLTLVAAMVCIAWTVPASRAAIRSVRHHGTDYLLLFDVARYYGMEVLLQEERILMVSQYSCLEFQADRRRMVLNGVPVHQAYAPSTWQDEPLISREDFLRGLEPVLRRHSLPRERIKRVVIDPGHGGKDPGAKGDRSLEKRIVLELGLRLARKLRSSGVEVVLTRADDRFLPLEKRSAVANRANGDLFVSLHTNAVADPSVHGIETFALTAPGTPSTYGDKRSAEAGAGDPFIERSVRLGYEIQKQLCKSTRAHSRGLRRANFAVLRNTASPSVLVEVGFITHNKEERRLLSTKYQERIAGAIAEAIQRYARAVAPEPDS